MIYSSIQQILFFSNYNYFLKFDTFDFLKVKNLKSTVFDTKNNKVYTKIKIYLKKS